jgi:hypothetical protein
VPVIGGVVSYLLLSKLVKGVAKYLQIFFLFLLAHYPLIGAYYISNVILFMSALGH